ncbi:MAG: hypothetical protein H7834_11780 [Magnetococcus sp. YQC-9]
MRLDRGAIRCALLASIGSLLLAGPLWAFGEGNPSGLPEAPLGQPERGGLFRGMNGPGNVLDPGADRPLNLLNDDLFQKVEEPPAALPPKREKPGNGKNEGGGRNEKVRPEKAAGDAGKRPATAGDAAGRPGQKDGAREDAKRSGGSPDRPVIGGQAAPARPIERVEDGFLSGDDPLFGPAQAPDGRGRDMNPRGAGMDPRGLPGGDDMPLQQVPRGVLTLPSGPLTDPSKPIEGWNPGNEWFGGPQDGNLWK